MSDPYAAGAVWWCRIDFSDGEGERKKYFVLLSDCPETGEALLAFTTSRARRYHGQTASPCGCPANSCYRIEAREEPCFSETSFVQFDNTWTVTRQKLATLATGAKAEFIQALNAERTRSILNCAMKSEDMTGRALQLVKRTLDAFKLARKTPPKGQPVAPAPPVGVVAVRRRYEAICMRCRGEFVSLVGIPGDKLAGILAETQPPPATFLVDAEIAFEFAREQSGPGCTCKP